MRAQMDDLAEYVSLLSFIPVQRALSGSYFSNLAATLGKVEGMPITTFFADKIALDILGCAKEVDELQTDFQVS